LGRKFSTHSFDNDALASLRQYVVSYCNTNYRQIKSTQQLQEFKILLTLQENFTQTVAISEMSFTLKLLNLSKTILAILCFNKSFHSCKDNFQRNCTRMYQKYPIFDNLVSSKRKGGNPVVAISALIT